MRSSRRLPVLVAGLAAALLVGCSDGGSGAAAPAPSPSPSPEGPSPAAIVRAAAMATDEQKASRYVLTTSTRLGDQEVVFEGAGIYDWTTDTGQTTYSVPAGTVQQRLVGPDLYLALPQQADTFFRLRVADLAATPLGGTVDPSAQLHMLAAVGDAEVVGEEQVRGEPTTHYRGSYDVARAIRGARGVQKDALRSSLGAGADLTVATYDVFLDRDGLLRRLTQTLDVPASPTTGREQPMTVTTTLELYDFGITVTVNPPPGATVRDGTPLLAALREVLPKPAPPTPAAPPVSPEAVQSLLPTPAAP